MLSGDSRGAAGARVQTATLATEHSQTEKAGLPSAPSVTAGLSLTHNFMWSLPANLIYAGCQWALIVLLAKISSVEVVGQFALATAVAVPITFLADFRLRVLFVTDAVNKYPFREMLGLRFILCCLSIVAILITCGIVGYGSSTTLLTLVVGSAYIVDLISETYYAKFQRAERMDRVAKSMITRNIVSATAFTLLVYFTRRLLWGVCGLALGRALTLLFYDTRVDMQDLCASVVRSPRPSPLQTCIKSFRPAWNVRRQMHMLWVAFPLAISAIVVSVNGYVPRYLLESYLGHRAVGLYAAINYIPGGCFVVTAAMGYAVFARLSKLFAKGDLAAFKLLLVKVTGIYVSLGISGLLLSILAGRQILTLVYRPEYAEHVDLLRWLMIVGLVNCLTTSLQCGLTAASEFRVQVPLFAGVTGISLLGSAILIPRMGLVGAAVAALISSVVQLCASATLVFRAMGRRSRDLKSMKCNQLEPAL